MNPMNDELRINNRRAPRVAARVPVTLQFPGNERTMHTEDISYVGVFIACDDPLPLRKLVRFKAQIDEGGDPLPMIGIIAHRVNAVDAAENNTKAGMGIHVFPLGSDIQRTWRHFVRTEYDKDPNAREAVRLNEYPRLKVRFPNTSEMQIFARDHVTQGHVFIRSADLYPQGSRIWLEAIHPLTKASCAVEAIVLEFVETPRQNRGMRLQFPDPEAAAAKLAEFASA